MDKNAVLEIGLGVLLGGIFLIVLHNLFGGWLAKHGNAIHGCMPDGVEKPLPPPMEEPEHYES